MAFTSHMISRSRLFNSPDAPPPIRRPVTCSLHAKPASYSFNSSNGTSKSAVAPLHLFNKTISPTNPQNYMTNTMATTQEHSRSTEPLKSPSLLDYVHRYIKPYAVRGTLTALPGAVGRILMENHNLVNASNWLPVSFTAIAVAVIILLTDGFISQINDIFDLQIDKINNPQRSLSAGEISMNNAWSFVVGSAIVSTASAFFLKSDAFFLFVILQITAGYIYSAPPLNTKRSTFGAILTCATTHGYNYHLMVNAGAARILGHSFQLSPPIVFLTLFTTTLAAALGIMKDLPDIKGDKLNNVPTLAATYGPQLAASVGFGLLLLTYGGSIAAGVLYPQMFNSSFMIPAHVAIGSCVAFQAWKLHKNDYNKEASKGFYIFLWNLFNVEYLIFPFI